MCFLSVCFLCVCVFLSDVNAETFVSVLKEAGNILSRDSLSFTLPGNKLKALFSKT